MGINSELLQWLGLENIDVAYLFIGVVVCIVVLMILVIINMLQWKRLRRKYESFMKGKSAGNLEKDILALFDNQRKQEKQMENNHKMIRDLYRRQEKNFQKIGLIKYDAFREMGGKLSYSLVMLDEKNNGFVLNSVHSSEGCYSYTKKIVNGESEISLGEEEQIALSRAMHGTLE